MLTLVLVVLLILVVGVAVAATVGLVRGGLPEPATDVPPPTDGPVALPGDLDLARFQLAFRGYRMDQVDRVLDDARDALAMRDVEIARLKRIIAGDPDDERPMVAGEDDATLTRASVTPADLPLDDAFRRPADGMETQSDGAPADEAPADEAPADEAPADAAAAAVAGEAPAFPDAPPGPDPAQAEPETADAGRPAP